MEKKPVIAIFDVGKTNKKLLLFDEQYDLVHEECCQLRETVDEDGFACEDINALTNWVKNSFSQISTDNKYDIKAVNFSAYGASFVYLDENGNVFLPLYNYLKPYPQKLKDKFYATYGGESLVAKQTASPVLGSLNSGMQLYRLRHEKADAFAKIKWALHLPQYLSYILSSAINTDITSIGCHTNLWHFQWQHYHKWVKIEGIDEILPPIKDAAVLAGKTSRGIPVGIGLHDSSSALIPYSLSFTDPFVLLSTGTWCISLNPFNHSQLSDYELHEDCLCYLSHNSKPVKASRLFAGHEHEQQVKRLAEYFKTDIEYYKIIKPDKALLKRMRPRSGTSFNAQHGAMVGQSKFFKRELDKFINYNEAYHQLIADIIEQQLRSTQLVLKGTSVKRIFVDGGFSTNPIYMQFLADAFPGMEVYAASVPQASALGAALVIHRHWNTSPLPQNIIRLKLYSKIYETG